MPKQFLEDMVKAKRAREGSMREIKPKQKEIPAKEVREFKEYREVDVYDKVEFKTNKTPSKNKSKYFLWFVALASVLFCFFAVSLLFAKAKILVNPKIENVSLNENLSATKDSTGSGLSFDLVAIPGQESETVSATGQKNVSISATGTVVIFNSYSSASQTLNIDTKLEGSNGKVYKTQTKTVVPGMSKDGTPGQVQVGIYATAAGADYNSGPLDFTIIGFKGTPKYSKFTVRSESGTQITGGFIGVEPNVDPADETIALNTLTNTLQTSLLMKATAQIPDGYILFKNAFFLDTNNSDLTSVSNPDGTATLTLTGTLYGVILNENDLTTKIAQDNIQNYDESDVYIPNINNLVFSLVPATTATTISTAQNINFTLTGPAQIVWKLDTDKFMSDVLGQPKKDFTQILSKYPYIDSATLTISPVWKMSIPDQAKNVKVIVNYPQ